MLPPLPFFGCSPYASGGSAHSMEISLGSVRRNLTFNKDELDDDDELESSPAGGR